MMGFVSTQNLRVLPMEGGLQNKAKCWYFGYSCCVKLVYDSPESLESSNFVSHRCKELVPARTVCATAL